MWHPTRMMGVTLTTIFSTFEPIGNTFASIEILGNLERALEMVGAAL